MKRRVVVTGMGIVSPLGNDVKNAFARLSKLENCVERLEELDQFKGLNTRLGCKASFTRPDHWTRKTVRTMGDVAMYSLAATEQAVAQAGLTAEELESGRTGVAYGSCSGSIAPHVDFFSMLVDKQLKNVTSGTYLKIMPQTCAVNISVHFKTHGRLVPEEERDDRGHLLWTAEPAHRNRLLDLVLEFYRVCHFRFNNSWRHGVHRDLVARELNREGLNRADEPSLRRRVVHLASVSDDSRNG